MTDEVTHLKLAAEVAGVRVEEFASPTRRHVVVDGIRLHYLDWAHTKASPSVVFLHGGGLTAHTWDLTCLALRGDFRCLAPDLRGHGDSEWSPTLDYGLEAGLRDLVRFIDQLKLRRPVLVGHSLGGVHAMRYASRHPNRLSGLVLVDIAPRPGPGQLEHVMRFLMGPTEFASIDEVVERAVEFNPRRDPRLLRNSLRHALRTMPNGRWMWKRDSRHLSQEWFAGIAAQIETLEDEAATVRCPVLIVRGEDGLPTERAAAFAARFPDARVSTVGGAGHTVQGDNPAGLIEVLRPFFAEVTSWR